MGSTDESFGWVLRSLLSARGMTATQLATLLSRQLKRPVSADTVQGWISERHAAPDLASGYVEAICAVLPCDPVERARLVHPQIRARVTAALLREGVDASLCQRVLATLRESEASAAAPDLPSRQNDGAFWLAEGVRLLTAMEYRKALGALAIAAGQQGEPATQALISAYAAVAWNGINQWQAAHRSTDEALALLGLPGHSPHRPPHPTDLLRRLRTGDLPDQRLQAYALLTKVSIDLWHHAGKYSPAQHCCDTLAVVAAELADPGLRADLAQLRATTLYELATHPAFGSGRVVRDREILEVSLQSTRQAIRQRPAADARGQGMDFRQHARTLRIRNQRGDREHAEVARQEAERSLAQSPARVSLVLELARAATADRDSEQAVILLEQALVLAWRIESPHLIADAALSRAALHHPHSGALPSHERATASCLLALLAWPFGRRAREYQVATRILVHDLGINPAALPALVDQHREHLVLLEQLPGTRERMTPPALLHRSQELDRCA